MTKAITQHEFQAYRDQVLQHIAHVFTEFYISRRFTASTQSGVEPDLDLQLRGVWREKEPDLGELLKIPKLLILAEPGGGKSVVAYAAARHFATIPTYLPVHCELKEYHGSLKDDLLSRTVSSRWLDDQITLDGQPLDKAYVLDGLDEVPSELLQRFTDELAGLISGDHTCRVVLTARQAFYATRQNLLPFVPAIFHLLDFSDSDIEDYVRRNGVDPAPFLQAIRSADANNEISNPFVLSIMLKRYHETNSLSESRCENMSYVIGRLIESRSRMNHHRLRRVLGMLGVALETYSRNEITEDEALGLIKESWGASEPEAHGILEELSVSVLKRTASGLAFQMRSYGEFLAAEALQDATLDRFKELAFLDYSTPNDSWMNAVSYLAELNRRVRSYFVQQHAVWMITASPSAFSEDEKLHIVTHVLESASAQGRFIVSQLEINTYRLSRFITPAIENRLLVDLNSADQVKQGNTLVLLGLRQNSEAVRVALGIAVDRHREDSIRYCAFRTLMNAGGPEHVSELVAALDHDDKQYENMLDTIGALADESLISEIMPQLIRTQSLLSNAFYHLRNLDSREAVVAVLMFAIQSSHDFDSIRAEGYLEPIVKLIPRFWDKEIADLCAELIVALEQQRVCPNHGGLIWKLVNSIGSDEQRGDVARLVFEKHLAQSKESVPRWFFTDQIIAQMLTIEAAQWLIEQRATAIIKGLSGYVRGPIRELFRPHSEGVIDAQEAAAQQYAADDAQRDSALQTRTQTLQQQLLSATTIEDALKKFAALTKDHWPVLSPGYMNWLQKAVAELLVKLDLEHSVEWRENALWAPTVLSLLMQLLERYELTIEPDESLIFAVTGLNASIVARYYKRSGLSEAALNTVTRLLMNPNSPQALQYIVDFVREANLWRADIEGALRQVVLDADKASIARTNALYILNTHGVEDAFVQQLLDRVDGDLKQAAFLLLVDRQHRPTIERALSDILDNDAKVREGESHFSRMSSLGWIANVRSQFAWMKLAQLREKTLRLELPGLCGLVTEILVKIDRPKAAQLIRGQISAAPQTWRHAQQSIASEQERAARIEQAQKTPFDKVLVKLRGATSIDRLKIVCEGQTDLPVYKQLLAQVPGVPEVLFDFVGGWPALQDKDPEMFLGNCKEVIIVMDGDEGRYLTQINRPLTKAAQHVESRVRPFPITLRVLMKYGIENYFPRAAMEAILLIDLSPYYPIPDHVSVANHMSSRDTGLIYRIRVRVADLFALRRPSATRTLYSKSRNEEVAGRIMLTDLENTDLLEIINLIAQRAKELAS